MYITATENREMTRTEKTLARYEWYIRALKKRYGKSNPPLMRRVRANDLYIQYINSDAEFLRRVTKIGETE
jgi:hypothetical protein